MLLMDEANDPPPTPERSAHAIKVLKLQLGSDKTMPAMIMGIQSRRLVE